MKAWRLMMQNLNNFLAIQHILQLHVQAKTSLVHTSDFATSMLLLKRTTKSQFAALVDETSLYH